MKNIKKLEIVSDGTPSGTVIKFNGEVVELQSILFAITSDDVVATLQIEPTFDYNQSESK